MSGSNVIELNGKKYDTRTGALVQSSPAKKAAKKPVEQASRQKAPAKQHASHATPAHKPSKPVAQPTPAAAKPAPAKAKPRSIDGIRPVTGHTRTAAKHAKRRAPQRSQTLMRRTATRQSLAPTAQVVVKAATPPVVYGSALQPSIDTRKLKRAKEIKQDKRISRFGILELPQTAETTNQTAPAEQTVATPPVEAPELIASAAPHTNQFEKAIANATSHTQARPAAPSRKAHHKVARKLRVKPRTVAASAAVLAFVMLGGFATYLHMPQIRTRIASSRAGISGSLPSHAPSGFNLSNNIGYSDGQIILTYDSQANDGREFTITQSESFWTSDSLRENFLRDLGTEVQTIQDNGKTLYLYDGNATWVDGGIWYRVDARDARLSSQQLSEIAESL